MSINVINKLPKFTRLSLQALDRSLNRMAIDIERLSKAQVPVGPTKKQKKSSKSSGYLRSSGNHKRLGFLRYVTYYNTEYARYQEFGRRSDGSNVIKKHTKPGTKTFYLKDPGDMISKKAIEYFNRELSKVRL